MNRQPALGDAPVAPFYNPMSDCTAMSSDNYFCIGTAGHTRGDIPHVAYGITSGCLAIWDDTGREVSVETHPIGATLDDARVVTS